MTVTLSRIVAGALILWSAFQGTRAPQTSIQPYETQDLDAPQLLIQSYVLSTDFVPQERALLLQRLCLAGVRIEPALARVWAEDLFALSYELPLSHRRVAHQKNALVVIAFSDPERAMDLLLVMDKPVPLQDGRIPEDVRADGARAIFAEYHKRRGAAALERIRVVAQHLGQTGEYPYAAIVPTLEEMAQRDLPGAQSMFEEAVSYYGQDSRIRGQDQRFLRFLLSVRGFIPNGSLRLALKRLVTEITARASQKDAGEHFVAEVYTDKGPVQLHERSDAILVQLLPMIREVDAQWARDLVDSRPEIKRVLETGTPLRVGTVVIRGNADPRQMASLQREAIDDSRLAEVEELAQRSPEEALNLAETIQDPVSRSAGLSAVVRGAVTKNRTLATSVFEEMKQSTETIKDDLSRLEVLSSLASAAAALGDKTAFWKAFNDGLDLGEELFQSSLDANPTITTLDIAALPPLERLVEAGIEIEPQAVSARILQIENRVLRAHLLVSAAEALERRRSKISNAPPPEP